jgi:hypothetical protein
VKAERRVVRLAHRDEQEVEVVAEAYGPIAIHRTPGTRCWQVVHILSGLGVFRDMDGKAAAIRAAQRLAEEVEWGAGEWRVAPKGPRIQASIRAAWEAAYGERL